MNQRIIFMGTPAFAVESLSRLLDAGCNIVAVVTAPDKPAGRGRSMNQSDVKKFAMEKCIPVLQPLNLKDPTFIGELQSYKADLQIVVAFRMLPEIVWNMPRLGTYNLHASLLPCFRGAAPINWAVISGRKETGVTTFKLQHEIDSGKILLAMKEEIGETETAGELHDKLMLKGAGLLVKTVKMVCEADENNTTLIFTDQDTSKITHAPKLNRQNCRIDWNKKGMEIYNLIRGLSPYPGAWTTMQMNGAETEIKIFNCEFLPAAENALPVGRMHLDKSAISVNLIDGKLRIIELQLQGKKKMSAQEFLNGFRNQSEITLV